MAKNTSQQDQEETAEANAVPFSLEQVASSGAQPFGLSADGDAGSGPSGQFNGEDLEFESFMFDSGDMQGLGQALAPQVQASEDAAPAMPWISGQTVPAPSQGAAPQDPAPTPAEQPPVHAGAFVEDPGVPQTPPASALDALQALSENIGNLIEEPSRPLTGPLSQRMVSGPLASSAPLELPDNKPPSGPLNQRLASGPLTPQMIPPSGYPSSVAGWNDQLLASVKDFSTVLLALRESKPQPAAPVSTPQAKTKTRPSSEDAAHAVLTMDPAAPDLSHLIVDSGAAPNGSTGAPSVDAAAAPDLSHLFSGEASDPELSHPTGHTGWTSVQLDASMLGPAEETATPQAEAPPEQEAVAALPWLDSVNTSGEAGPDSPAPPSEPAIEVAPPAEPQAELAPPAAQPEMQAAEPPWEPTSAPPEPAMEVAALIGRPVHAPAPQETTREEAALNDAAQPPWAAAEPAQDAPMAAQPSLEDQAPVVAELASPAVVPEPMPEPAAPAPEAPTLQAASAEVAASSGAPDLPEGGLSGDDLEFESFMFDSGAAKPLPSLPNIGEFMPAVQSMESTITPQAQVSQAALHSGAVTAGAPQLAEPAPAEDPDESLPFWLQDAAGEDTDAAASPAAGPQADASYDPSAALQTGPASVQAAQPYGPGPAPAAAAPEDDSTFSQLPPIEPFDFTMVQAPQPVETFGFNSDELAGAPATVHEPMMVTANLDELAELLGKDRADFMLPDSGAAKLLLGQIMENPTRPGSPSPPAGPDRNPGFAHNDWAPSGPPPRPTAWTATETSKLTAGAPGALVQGMPAPRDLPGQAMGGATSTEELTVGDLDITPFDITELDLNEEEQGTGFLAQETLDTGLLRPDTGFLPVGAPQPSPEPDDDSFFTGTLFTAPNAPTFESPDYWEAPNWMDSDDPSPQATGTANQTLNLVTGQLAPSQQDYAEDDSEMTYSPDSIFKVRVSKFKPGQPGLLSTGPMSEVPAEPPPAPAAASDPAWAPSTPPQAEATSLDMPPAGPTFSDAVPGTHMDSTGPLPTLQGFEQLEGLVKENPEDLGAHMALAVAYAQAGHIEHALHEYRRLLKNRHVPGPMLQLLSDLLEDMEEEATGFVRFHQARGDLYMKQGRYGEAIQEYNKIK